MKEAEHDNVRQQPVARGSSARHFAASDTLNSIVLLRKAGDVTYSNLAIIYNIFAYILWWLNQYLLFHFY